MSGGIMPTAKSSLEAGITIRASDKYTSKSTSGLYCTTAEPISKYWDVKLQAGRAHRLTLFKALAFYRW
jgi:hypothetical protein